MVGTALAARPSGACAQGASPQEAPITTGTLVRQMTDLERLTRFPEPAYKTVQFSSYDRRSDVPGGPGWHANSDGFGGEPIPNVEAVLEEAGADGVGTYLLCDVEGPGAMVRTWTANMNGQVRLYLDGAEEPLYDDPAGTFFRQPWRPFLQSAGLDTTLVQGTFAQRDAGYFPIPFGERLRVEWTGKLDEVHFYELQVRRYAPGTAVQTFTPEDLQTYEAAIREAARVLADPSERYPYPAGTERIFTQAIPAGEARELIRLEGPAALARLTLNVGADSLTEALRQSVLHITFDGAPWAQVQAPLGDFFGAAPGLNPFDALSMTAHPDGRMTTRFVMPFADSVSVRIQNRGARPVTIRGSALRTGYDWNAERSMHFRARWRADLEMNERSPYDLPFVLADGQGLYVGTASYLYNPVETPTSFGNWWGEGDEKIFVDEDRRPSTFGTGTEDYYNYSWAAVDLFQTPYAGQPRNDGPGNRGFVANHRWHVLDPLPFQDRLRFYMEFYTNFPRKGFSYARLSYLYGRPGLMDDHVPIADGDLRIPERTPWRPQAKKGAEGAAFYQTEELTGTGRADLRAERSHLWAGGQLMVWTPEETGATLDLPVSIPDSGRYRLVLTLARTPQSGVVSVWLDGERLTMRQQGGPIFSWQDTLDLRMPHRTAARNYGSRPLDLTAGKHTLTLRCEDCAESAEAPRRNTEAEIGIDFVWVQAR